MIECCSENIYYVKRQRNKNKKLYKLVILFLVLALFLSYYNYFIIKQVYNFCTIKTRSICSEMVNQVVLDSLGDKQLYEELIYIEKNSSGDVVLITSNTNKINLINRSVAFNTQKNLNKTLKNGIKIPIFTFSGIGLLAGYGKEVNFKTLNTQSVTCDFLTDFNAVGINQTLHSLYLDVKCLIEFQMPFATDYIECKTKILITETVIIGKVPEIYLNGLDILKGVQK